MQIYNILAFAVKDFCRLKEPELLSFEIEKPIADLLAEAIADLVRKYGRTEVAYSTVAPESKKGKN